MMAAPEISECRAIRSRRSNANPEPSLWRVTFSRPVQSAEGCRLSLSETWLKGRAKPL